MKPQDATSFEFMGAITLVRALMELDFMLLFMGKADKLPSPTHVPIAIVGVFKRTDDIEAFIAKETKAFLENIPKEWEEYWLRAFAERLKAFLDEIDNAEGDGA